MNWTDFWPVYLGLVLAVILAYKSYRREKKQYNGGRCRICYGELRHFDNDSQGGRGYCCHNGHYIWICWAGIDKVKP